MWQALRNELHPRGFELVAVGLDTLGDAGCRTFIEAARPEHPSLIEREHSLADLFGSSVDRYREASDKWLTGLSTMRAVAERSAQVDAQDLLAAYLEQTREVFDQTLAFQRQLFAELRKTTTRTEDAEIVSSPRLLSTGHDAPGEAEE